MARSINLWLAFLLMAIASSGQDAPKAIYVESWKKGEVKVQEQKLALELTRRNRKHKTIIYDAAGVPRYWLQIRPGLSSKEKPHLYDSWWVDLCDFKGPHRTPNPSWDCRLLGTGGPGPGGDHFPKEDNMGLLYPVEKPDFFKLGVMAYPILAKRIIKVEGYYCVIRVSNYKMSPANPRALDSMTVEVEFTNKYEAPKPTA